MTVTAGLLTGGRRSTRTDTEVEPSHVLRAADPATPPWDLATLADDPDPDVRQAVASNPSASELTMLRLRRDPDPRVRLVVTACRPAEG